MVVMNPQILLLMILAGGAIMVATFVVLAVGLSVVNYEETPVRDRLLALKGKNRDGLNAKQKGPFDDLKESLLVFSAPIAKSFYGSGSKAALQMKNALTAAGLPDTDDHVTRFMAGRIATGIVVAGGLFVSTLVLGNVAISMFCAVFGFTLGSMAPMFILRARAGSRQAEIRFKLSDTLDLMVVCVEAGLGLDATINRVGRETEYMAPEIAQEFKRLTRELNAGISRTEAFQNLGSRSGVDELKSLCALIIQTDKLGTSIGDTLRIYADDLRVKRRQRAEELASKASIKMTFPLVMLIFPPIFIVLIGPIVVNALKTFGFIS